jgi:hypothetical protein
MAALALAVAACGGGDGGGSSFAPGGEFTEEPSGPPDGSTDGMSSTEPTQ